MKWIPVYHADTMETVIIDSYECSACGYVASRKWVECPHCREEWIPDSTEEYEESMK